MPVRSAKEQVLRFPDHFLWGSAISAYQTEGGNNNQWSVWEKEGGHIKDGSVCGKADDFYHLYEKDLDLAKALGHNSFRFSVEWSRIEPMKGVWDPKEVEHYRNVLKAIRVRGITPLVTIHHFTNPLWMEAEGGWVNEKSVDYFARYATYLARELGDLFDLWGPINEPTAYASVSYMLGKFPPCVSDLSKYQSVLRNMLLAHAQSYHCIHDVLGKNRSKSAPKIGTIKDTEYFQPYNENSQKDKEQARFLNQFYNASFLDAISTGRINPPMGTGETNTTVKGAWDFIGFNYYTRTLCTASGKELLDPDKHLTREDSLGITDMGYEIYPEGIHHIISWLRGYDKPIFVTENGCAVKDDDTRSMYIVLHLKQVYKAIRDGADVRAYYYWSLIDNFEWDSGFDKRFGIVEVDYKSLRRTPRQSAHTYSEIIRNNGIPSSTMNKYDEMGVKLRQKR